LLTAAGALLLPLAAHAQVTPPATGAPTDDSVGATAPAGSAPDPSGATTPADPAASSTAPADGSATNATTSTDTTRHHKKMRKQKTPASSGY
jgi:hypothetical protein